MATNLARFTINGTAAEDANGLRGYDATAGEELTITLEKNPALGVLTVTYQLFDSTEPFGETPLNSLFDTDQVFDENGAREITTSSPNDVFHVTINPATEISSYTLRALVVTATGVQLFERLIAVRKNGLRMTVPAESLQYNRRGWSDALNELTKAVADGLAGVTLVSSGATGTVAAFPAGQRRIFHSDGSTVGGSWAQLTSADLDAAIGDGALAVTKLVPGANGQVLRTSGGVAAWGADVTLNAPVPLIDDGRVALAGTGDLVYGLIADAQIDAAAAITVAKLAPGINGQVLKTVGGVATWSSDSQLNAPANPGDDGRVALASSGDLVYGLISNTQVDASANIAVSKLAAGTEGYVLKTVAGVPTWAVEGGAGANLPANPGDNDKLAFAAGGNLSYTTGMAVLNPGGAQNGLSMAGTLYTSGGAAPATPTGSEGVLWNNSGAIQWTTASGTVNVLQSPQPVSGTDDGKVAIASGGVLSYSLLTNANIASGAAISETKLAGGADNTVLNTAGSTPTWSLLVDDNIDAGANISVAKLAPGTANQYLRTVGGVALWTSTLDGSQLSATSVTTAKIAPGANQRALITNAGGTVEWAQLSDAYISATAAIAVTKLATGSANSVLASDGNSNFWDTTPTVSTLTGTQALITQGYIDVHSISEPANAPTNGARIFVTGNGILGAKFDDNTVWEFAAEIFN